jgi:hypothetical protein
MRVNTLLRIAVVLAFVLVLGSGSVRSDGIPAPHHGPSNTVDTTSIRVDHATDFLRLQLPSNLIFVPTDSFKAIHPAEVYFRYGFRGWNRWMVLTPGSDHLEDPFLRVSNDGIHWYRFGVGSDSCPDPLVTETDVNHKGQIPSHLSDGDLFKGWDGKLWMIFRASYSDLTDTAYDALYAMSTPDGITWSKPTLITPYYPNGASLISPAVWRNSGGGYRMWTVEPAMGPGEPTCMLLWQALVPNQLWQVVDTVRQAGTTTAWPGTDQLSGLDSAWHVESISNGRHERLILLTAKNGITHPLYIGKSIDNGRSVDFRHEPLLSPVGDGVSWDSYDLYRSSGILLDKGTETVLELIYPGKDADTGVWRVGRTEVHFNALGPVALLTPTIPPDSDFAPTVYSVRPQFTWTAALGSVPNDSVIYNLQVSDDSSFSHMVIEDSTLGLTYQPSALLNTKTHYWMRLSDQDQYGRQSVVPIEGEFVTMVPGDINESQVVDLADLSRMVMYLTTGGWSSGAPTIAGDVNADCLVNLSDLSILVSYLTSGSPNLQGGMCP